MSISLAVCSILLATLAGDATAPTAVVADIAKVELSGLRSYQHLLVTGIGADGSERDLTSEAQFRSDDPAVATVDELGVVRPVANGTTQVHLAVGTLEATVPVTVRNTEVAQPVHFTHDVVAALTRSGCNSGACHGTPSGKNGFRLSLQGYLPDQDWVVLTREAFGRRVNRLDAERSLVLQKGSARIKHEGGRRFGPESESYRVLRDWIGEGATEPPTDSSQVTRLEIFPSKRVLRGDATSQQIVVHAHYSDGTARDVTPLVTFSSSDPSLAEVSKSGRVSFAEKGSVAILCRYLHLVESANLTHLRETPGFVWSDPPAVNYVDEHVFAKLEELQIQPAPLCRDEEFIRRLYLDVLGVLPSPEEVQVFLTSDAGDKRDQLIEDVLARPEYADLWAMRWADVLRSTRKKISYRGTHNFRRYLVDVFARNRPFDEFARELVTATGDTMINPAANYYRVARDPDECAETTAQLFLGVRMQCAKCHNHPFERWTQDDYYGLAACFARVGRKQPDPKSDREVVYTSRRGEVKHLRTGSVMTPQAPGSEPFAADDRQRALAEWLTGEENPFFARSVVNRIWFHLFSKGIVEPVDDFRDSNPPRIESLLNALAADFVQSGFDYKQIVRTILRSRTYQLSAQTGPTNAEDTKYFSHAYTQLLPAEVLLDALSQATGVSEKFPGLPLGTRAVQLPDPEVNHGFLQAFGQPSRELVCECARESETTLTQALNLINGEVIHTKIRDPKNRVHTLLAAGADDDALTEALYLATLSRRPTDAERKTAAAHIAKIGERPRAFEDIQWALLNCKEFLFRH